MYKVQSGHWWIERIFWYHLLRTMKGYEKNQPWHSEVPCPASPHKVRHLCSFFQDCKAEFAAAIADDMQDMSAVGVLTQKQNRCLFGGSTQACPYMLVVQETISSPCHLWTTPYDSIQYSVVLPGERKHCLQAVCNLLCDISYSGAIISRLISVVAWLAAWLGAWFVDCLVGDLPKRCHPCPGPTLHHWTSTGSKLGTAFRGRCLGGDGGSLNLGAEECWATLWDVVITLRLRDLWTSQWHLSFPLIEEGYYYGHLSFPLRTCSTIKTSAFICMAACKNTQTTHFLQERTWCIICNRLHSHSHLHFGARSLWDCQHKSFKSYINDWSQVVEALLTS